MITWRTRFYLQLIFQSIWLTPIYWTWQHYKTHANFITWLKDNIQRQKILFNCALLLQFNSFSCMHFNRYSLILGFWLETKAKILFEIFSIDEQKVKMRVKFQTFQELFPQDNYIPLFRHSNCEIPIIHANGKKHLFFGSLKKGTHLYTCTRSNWKNMFEYSQSFRKFQAIHKNTIYYIVYFTRWILLLSYYILH